MIEQVYKNIYKIEVRLPNNPLKALNAYLIKGETRSLLIDTGFNREECKEDLLQGIKAVGVKLEALDIFITHLHADHSGLIGLFAETSEHIYSSQIDGNLINQLSTHHFIERIEKNLIQFDLVKDQIDYKDHPAHKYSPAETKFTTVIDGEIIRIGEYEFEVVDTAGHTPGLMGLYEREHKLYFSADHVLDQITPNISFWSFEFNSLDVYLKNLTKMINYEIDYIFPSHRNIMNDHPRRINELLEHHKERIEEVYKLVIQPLSVRDIAAKMQWNIRAKDWNDFPSAQKMFASGEAMAHLEYLYHQGRLVRDTQKGILYFVKA